VVRLPLTLGDYLPVYMCLFFSVGHYFIRNICVDFFTEAVSHRARAFDVS